MRVDQSSCQIGQSTYLARLAQNKQQSAAGAFTLGAAESTGANDSVKISQAARDAYASTAWGGQSGTESVSNVREDFLTYMQQSREAPKSTKEKIEDLKKKLDKLKDDLAKTASDEKMPEATKKAKIQNLNSQINDVLKQLGELETQLAKELARESSGEFFSGA